MSIWVRNRDRERWRRETVRLSTKNKVRFIKIVKNLFFATAWLEHPTVWFGRVSGSSLELHFSFAVRAPSGGGRGEREKGRNGKGRERERETGREKGRAREGEKVELIINSLSIVFQSFLFFAVFASKLKKIIKFSSSCRESDSKAITEEPTLFKTQFVEKLQV